MTEHQFKPCPFCERENIGVILDKVGEKYYYGVICHWCGAKIPTLSKTPEIAVKRWNKRPIEKKLEKELK